MKIDRGSDPRLILAPHEMLPAEMVDALWQQIPEGIRDKMKRDVTDEERSEFLSLMNKWFSQNWSDKMIGFHLSKLSGVRNVGGIPGVKTIREKMGYDSASKIKGNGKVMRGSYKNANR